MCCTKNGHNNRGGKVVQPNGSTQKVKYGKHRKRHWHKEKCAVQQVNLSFTDKIADPYGIVQYQEYG